LTPCSACSAADDTSPTCQPLVGAFPPRCPSLQAGCTTPVSGLGTPPRCTQCIAETATCGGLRNFGVPSPLGSRVEVAYKTERGAPGGRRSSSYVRSRRPRGVTSRPGSEVELLGVGAPGIPLWVQHGGSRGRRDIVRWCYSLGSGPVGTARLDESRFRPPPGTSTFVRCLGVTPRGESGPGVAWPALLKAGHHASPGRRSEATP
jgi:hypothetical protein